MKSKEVASTLWVDMSENRGLFTIRIYAKLDNVAIILREVRARDSRGAHRAFRTWSRMITGE